MNENVSPSAYILLLCRAVLDVFDAFLSIESPHVFANAALDCIGCLVRHIRGSEERRQLEEIVEIDVNQFFSLFIV
jgi:hypothetical protein